MADVDANLLEVVASLGHGERECLLAIAKRLALGARAYGALDPRGDPRSWRKEASEEALDLAVYLSCELLRTAGK